MPRWTVWGLVLLSERPGQQQLAGLPRQPKNTPFTH
jgi:hypothetical protein